MKLYFMPVAPNPTRELERIAEIGVLQPAFQFVRFANLDVYSSFAHLCRWDENYRARPAASAVLSH